MTRPSPVLLRCVLLGLAAGSRTFMPVAAVTLHRSPRALSTRLATAAAAGELVFDKLPQAPSRLDPPGLAARAATSAIAGAMLVGLPGALAGTLAALAAAPVVHHARRALGRLSGAPDWMVGGAEDGLAIALAAAAVRGA